MRSLKHYSLESDRVILESIKNCNNQEILSSIEFAEELLSVTLVAVGSLGLIGWYVGDISSSWINEGL